MTPNKHLWCVIMAGGLGSRFWPVSRTDNPKQFIDVTGSGSSMLQSTTSSSRLSVRTYVLVTVL